MARSAALNPASMPFFPGGGSLRVSDEELSGDFRGSPHPPGQHDRMSTTHSTSPSDYRSVRSSPSPSQNGVDQHLSNLTLAEALRSSPTFRPGEGPRRQSHTIAEARTPREMGKTSSLDSVAEGQDTPMPPLGSGDVGFAHPSSFFSLQQQGRLSTPPVSISVSSISSSLRSNGAFVASSPASSLDSGSNFAVYSDHGGHSFDAQLRSSPLIQELLERLVVCESTTRDIHRDLLDVNRKVNILVERTLSPIVANNQQPEFKDPFSPKANVPTFNMPALSAPRPSISGGIAPHQTAPSDDISSISQRLNTLTSSVGQLLAMQTQQMQGAPSLLGNSRLSTSPMDISPHQQINPPNVQPANQPMIGLGLPGRADMRSNPRAPNPPMRTWSAGAIDVPLRPGDAAAQRPDSRVLDKRRSVSGLLRRESTGLSEPPPEPFGNSRESGPVISKWEQLALSPDLLRSLNKFGVGPPNKIQQRALPFLLKGSDIIAQAPPTQERIAAYVIPAIQTAVTNIPTHGQQRGPIVIMISTTVDQATQAQRMIRDLGGPIGVRSALGVGAASADLSQELRQLHQNMPHIICGTPQKLHALLTAPGGIAGSEVRFLVLDEVDQLIARNLHDFVFNIVKLLPQPRSRPPGSTTSTIGGPNPPAPPSSFNMDMQGQGRRFSNVNITPSASESGSSSTIERQTALFSNTVPQDVLNLASAIQLREPVRVLVRRDGNVAQSDSSQSSKGLRQFYLYLAFTAGGRSDPTAMAPGGGLGIIGSGRGASSSAESAQAREWKLDALADLFDDVEVTNAVVHVGGMTALDSVVYKLASRGLEAIPLHGDMNAGTKLAALNKFRNNNTIMMRQPTARVLVVYDVQVKTPDVSHVPLIINYDLPKAVEEYALRVAPAIASGYARAGVVVNFVTATGGDVEMLRSIECFYKIKCPEVPMSLRDIV